MFDVTGEATVGVMDWSIRAVEGGGVTLGAGGTSWFLCVLCNLGDNGIDLVIVCDFLDLTRLGFPPLHPATEGISCLAAWNRLIGFLLCACL